LNLECQTFLKEKVIKKS